MEDGHAIGGWELWTEEGNPTARRATATGSWITGLSLLALLGLFVAYMFFGDHPDFAKGVPSLAVWMSFFLILAALLGTFFHAVLKMPHLSVIAAVPLIFFGLFLSPRGRDEYGNHVPRKVERMAASKALGLMAIYPVGGLVLGFVLSGIEQKLVWLRSEDRIEWLMRWGLGTVRKNWRHEELRAIRFEDHEVEYNTKHGKQKISFAKLLLMEQNGTLTELVSSGPLLDTRRAAEALARHFDLKRTDWVVRDGKVTRSSGDLVDPLETGL